jgi:hypothetical protein
VAFHVRRFNGWLAEAPAGKTRRAPGTTQLLQVESTAAIVATAPSPSAGSWLMASAVGPNREVPTPSAAVAAPGVRVLADKPQPGPVSLENWLTGPSADSDGNGSAVEPEPEKGSTVAIDDDDIKWAPLAPLGASANGFTTTKHANAKKSTPDLEPAWDDVLVKPGAGTTRRPH